MKINRSIAQGLFSIVFILAILGFLVLTLLFQRPIPRAPIATSHISSMTSLWIRTNYYMYSSDGIQMVALGNKLFIIGSALDAKLPRLIALDAYTGDIIWQYDNDNVNVLASSPTKLFVGELGGGKVVALNPDAGTVLWSTNLYRNGNVTKVLVRDNVLYVDTIGKHHVVLDAETGKLLQTIDYTIDNGPNPDIPIWSDHNMNLQFVGDIMYFQKQTVFPIDKGEIIAIDNVNGNQIWSSGSLYALTRIATSSLGIFVLDSAGALLRFNATDGTKNQEVQFAPTPVLRSEDGWVYGYYVAVDSDNRLLFVYLGDSAQLFAFHIQ